VSINAGIFVDLVTVTVTYIDKSLDLFVQCIYMHHVPSPLHTNVDGADLELYSAVVVRS
jgi:hypothetical protein